MAIRYSTSFEVPDPAAPELARVAALVVALVKHCRAESWQHLHSLIAAEDEPTLRLLAEVELSDEENEAIGRHSNRLTPVSVKPAITIAVCPDCGGAIYVTPKGFPKRCLMREGCPGTPVKAAAPKRIRTRL